MNQLNSYSEIKAYPKEFNASTVLSRIIDGIGFRYYWATEGLSDNDLKYTPGNDNRTVYQTLNHIFNMVDFASTIIENKVFDFPEKNNGFSLSEFRKKTLERIEELKKGLMASKDKELETKLVKVKVNGNYMEFPIWHFFNGPLVDSIYHLGQIVAFRRANGNPINPAINPFMGK